MPGGLAKPKLNIQSPSPEKRPAHPVVTGNRRSAGALFCLVTHALKVVTLTTGHRIGVRRTGQRGSAAVGLTKLPTSRPGKNGPVWYLETDKTTDAQFFVALAFGLKVPSNWAAFHQKANLGIREQRSSQTLARFPCCVSIRITSLMGSPAEICCLQHIRQSPRSANLTALLILRKVFQTLRAESP